MLKRGDRWHNFPLLLPFCKHKLEEKSAFFLHDTPNIDGSFALENTRSHYPCLFLAFRDFFSFLGHFFKKTDV